MTHDKALQEGARPMPTSVAGAAKVTFVLFNPRVNGARSPGRVGRIPLMVRVMAFGGCRLARLTLSGQANYDFCLPLVDSGDQGVSLDVGTPMPTRATVVRKWHVIDARGRVLGRVANTVVRLLQGKHKPQYTPFMDLGDHVIIVNAADVRLTGRKDEQKLYRRHSRYEGGLREERATILRQRRPTRLLEAAVRGMLPKTKLGHAMYRKLKVYAGPDHPHAAQQPSRFEVP